MSEKKLEISEEKRLYVNDKSEMVATLHLLKDQDEIVVSELSFGEYVTIKKELFENLVQEVNEHRLLTGNMEEGIDLIVLGEADG